MSFLKAPLPFLSVLKAHDASQGLNIFTQLAQKCVSYHFCQAKHAEHAEHAKPEANLNVHRHAGGKNGAF